MTKKDEIEKKMHLEGLQAWLEQIPLDELALMSITKAEGDVLKTGFKIIANQIKQSRGTLPHEEQLDFWYRLSLAKSIVRGPLRGDMRPNPRQGDER